MPDLLRAGKQRCNNLGGTQAIQCNGGWAAALILENVLYIGSSGKEKVLEAVDKMTGKMLWKIGDDTGENYCFQTVMYRTVRTVVWRDENVN